MIEYLGRNDHQIKIRGFRIELGEIEAQLRRQDGIRDAVVIAREEVPGDKRLVAYLISDGTSETIRSKAESLRIGLKSVLPEYMMPSAYVVLERFPLTPSGKLDRRALPPPDQVGRMGQRYIAPDGEVERALAGIWQHLLHVPQVGRNDNFFELGGHSLSA